MILESQLQHFCTNPMGHSVHQSVICQLTHESFCIQQPQKPRLAIKIDDILRVSTFADSSTEDRESLDFVVESLSKQTSRFTHRSKPRKLRAHRFICPTLDVKKKWLAAFKVVCPPMPPRQMIALVNSKSGSGKAKQHLEAVASIFETGNIQLRLAEIQGDRVLCRGVLQSFSNFFQTLDITQIDGLIICGGDGTAHSAINALMARTDWSKALKIPLGILPSGTDNGLCKTILSLSGESFDLTSAAFLIAKGQVRSLDIFKITQKKQTVYGIHSFAWGLISDIDINSNPLRFLGPLKEWIYGAVYVLRCKRYAGELFVRPQLASTDLPAQLIKIPQDHYIGVWAMNVPWAGKDWFTAPVAKLNDGCLDLLVFRKPLSRWKLIEILLRMQKGSHVNCSSLEYYKTSSIDLMTSEKMSRMTIDGELVDTAPVKIDVLPQCCQIFCV